MWGKRKGLLGFCWLKGRIIITVSLSYAEPYINYIITRQLKSRNLAGNYFAWPTLFPGIKPWRENAFEIIVLSLPFLHIIFSFILILGYCGSPLVCPTYLNQIHISEVFHVKDDSSSRTTHCTCCSIGEEDLNPRSLQIQIRPNSPSICKNLWGSVWNIIFHVRYIDYFIFVIC